LGEASETREAFRLDVRFAAFSASSLACISECGTLMSRRIKPVKFSELPLTILADAFGFIGPFSIERRVGDCVFGVKLHILAAVFGAYRT
jgi:hypothetical protein